MHAKQPADGDLSIVERRDVACDRFEAAWNAGESPRIEDYLNGLSEPDDVYLLRELVPLEIELSKEEPSVEAWVSRFPKHENLVRELVTALRHPTVLYGDGTVAQEHGDQVPREVRRYLIERLLGKGAFGRVYLAHDELLDRYVAIKIPIAGVLVAEAKILASLDHPHIVPVYDVGQNDECPCFVVTKYIKGMDLEQRMKESSLSHLEVAELIATVADALHYAHTKGLVHRDVKPGNILLDEKGKPYVADFGIALKEADVGKGPKFVGTPAYMSPEQCQGEGHRVDGRSDVYSLGAVMYELLVGRRTFPARTTRELLKQITTQEVKPLRQIDDSIPKELEQICLKALSKRVSDRYTTAMDMAKDLRRFRGISVGLDGSGNAIVTGDDNQVVIYQSAAQRREPEERRSDEIGPNPYLGLLAFHETDADRFFGREQQISRLWNKLRDLQQESTSQPGRTRLLPILGPSGSGKTSLARAGLIPQLARRPLPGWKDVRVAVLSPGPHPIEALARVLARIATGDRVPVERTEEFEQFMRRKSQTGFYDGLRRIADALPEVANVPLIVLIDQFEEIYSLCQNHQERTALIENLLHAASDVSGHVSVVITLRTDFLGETQQHKALNTLICCEDQHVMIPAMNEEELRAAITKPAELAGHPLDEATVTLLVNETKDHEGALPLLQFALTRIWDGLAEGIEPAATYRKIGGIGGALAGEAQRIYDALTAAEKRIAKRVFLATVQLGEGTRDTRRRAMVKDLVSVDEDRSDVERVIRRFAGRDARLLTLSADEHGEGDTAEVTHEALFDHWDKLNGWLDENREDLRFGRRLDEEARRWDQQDRPDGGLWRQPNLDLLREFHERVGNDMSSLQMDFFIASQQSQEQRLDDEKEKRREELETARRIAETERQVADEQRRRKKLFFYATVISAVLTLISVGFLIWALGSRDSAIAARDAVIRAQVDNLQTATPDAAAAILRALEKEESFEKAMIVDKLRSLLAGEGNSKRVIRVRLGLLVLDGDDQQIPNLRDLMLSAEFEDIDEFLLIRDELAPRFSSKHKQDLWRSVRLGASTDRLDRQQWLRAAATLAKCDPLSRNWDGFATDAAKELVLQNPLELAKWIDAFSPVATKLVEPLKATYASGISTVLPGLQGDSVEMRSNSASAIAVYLKDDPSELSDLILSAEDHRQFLPLVEELKDHAEKASPFLSDILNEGPHKVVWAEDLKKRIAEELKEHITEARKEQIAEELEQIVQDHVAHFDRQANAAAALLVLGNADEVWPLLANSDDPTRRTILIHRFRTLGVDPRLLFAGIADDQHDVSIHRAIILALGEYPAQRISNGDLEDYAKKLLELYRNAPDSGVHAAAEWTLNRWKSDQRLRSKNKPMDLQEEMNLAKSRWTANPNTEKQDWYLSPLGQKMVIIPKPREIEIQIGSPQLEIRRDRVENQRNVKIDWSFAIADKEVTNEQFTKFMNDKNYARQLRPEDQVAVSFGKDSTKAFPVGRVTWYMAAAYCNWLTEKELGIEAAQDQFCYNLNDDGKFAENMTMPADFIRRKGYRLPLEVEWEFACRAGTKTRWSHGEAENLLDRYANYTSMYPINQNPVSTESGNLKPNDFGLFAMHGNGLERCHDIFYDDLSKYNVEDDLKVSGDGPGRVTRGGSFIKSAFELRSANRYYCELDYTHKDSGFRVVRTYTSVE